MIFRNKKIYMISIIFLVFLFLYLPFRSHKIGNIIFGVAGFLWLFILYIFAIFEYYKVDDNKITHIYGFKKDEVLWKDIKRVFILPNSLFKVIRIDYGMLSEKNMLINSGVKEYKELVKIIIDKAKENPNISIEKRLIEFLNS